MKKYAGEEFLNRLYKDLVHSPEVSHTAIGRNKNEDLALYFEKLDRITKKASNRDKLDLLKYFYYKKYIINMENVPESYFRLQADIALDRGYGHIIYNENTKNNELNRIILEQKKSLDKWLDYFVSEDTNHYPMWFKYYVFQNVVKIGYFDKDKNEFTKRTNSTVKPFIEINREAIAALYDELCKYLDNQDLSDIQLQQLINNGSFPKIYSYLLNKITQEKKRSVNSNDGLWKKYERGSNPEILFNDLSGKATGWCTAGGIETAKAHLDGGDFYVYYTKNENDEYVNPRVAIRMEDIQIAEIRGIAKDQNLESEMETIVEEKLKEFPYKEDYKKKVSDMKKLTEIYNKHKNKEALTIDELRFLYEVDTYILGFGHDVDPRILEILEDRDSRKDYASIYGCSENEISFASREAISGNIKVHIGYLGLAGLTSAIGYVLPECVTGFLDLDGLRSAEGLVLPKYTAGINLSHLRSAEGIRLPKDEKGNFYVPGKVKCPFSDEELIEAAKRTEANQLQPRIFDNVDNLDLNTPKR